MRGREAETRGRRGTAPARPGRRRPLAAVVGMLLVAAGSGCAASPGATAVTSHPATASPAPAGTPAVGFTATPTAAVSPTPAPTAWSLVSSPNPPGDARQAALQGVSCLSATDCWAVGWWSGDPLSGSSEPLIAHESGGGWTLVTSPSPNHGSALNGVACTSDSACWAVGGSTGGDGWGGFIEQYAGGEWTIISSPAFADSFLSGVTCVSATDCWAVGSVMESSGPLIEQYTGSGWSVVPSPTPAGSTGASLRALTCVSADDCWAVGTYTDGAGDNGLGLEEPLVEQYQGSGWSPVTVPSPSGGAAGFGSELDAVTCVSAGDCWAVGEGAGEGLIEHYSPDGWAIALDSDRVLNLDAVACTAGDACAAAGFADAGPNSLEPELASVEDYQDGTWSFAYPPFPSGSTTSELDGMTCVSATDCLAVGGMPLPGGSAVSGPLLIEQYQPPA